MEEQVHSMRNIARSISEWGGCATGLAGAFLLALNTSISGWGFVLFLVSNACWFGYGYLMGAKGLTIQNIGFTASSVTGIVNWIFPNAPLFGYLAQAKGLVMQQMSMIH
jgi:hypothetical protein